MDIVSILIYYLNQLYGLTGEILLTVQQHLLPAFYLQLQQGRKMKPGTKSRKIGLEIPTVNPCNNFIIDYLIRNKIKSDKQVLCKSYLYNLAIEAVRKYPLPLICQEQLAALEGFGNFFIAQVARLIKRHYTRGRMPSERQMEEDDQAHFEALRGQRKLTDEKPVKGGYRQDLQDSPIFRSSTRQYDDKRKDYRPKRKTEPMNILESLHQLNGFQRPVTKGQINEVLFNQKKEKIRLWYCLKQKLQEYDFIQVDAKDSQFIYLTQKGKKYVQNYDKMEQQHQKGRKKTKKQEQYSEEGQQQDGSDEQNDKIGLSKQSKRNESYLEQQQQKAMSIKGKTKGKVQENKKNKLFDGSEIKKTILSKFTKFDSIDLLINQKDSNLAQKQALIDKCQQLSYQFCGIQLADFLWTESEGRILDYMAIRIKQQEFQEDDFKRICFRAKVTSCNDIYLIIQSNSFSEVKLEQQAKAENQENEKNAEKKLNNQKKLQDRNYLLNAARVAGLKVIKTKNLKETIQFIRQFTNMLLAKLQQFENIERSKKNMKKDKSTETEHLRHLGTLQKFNQKVGFPFEMSTITKECLKCIPDLTFKCVNILQEKFPTLAVMHNKIQDNGTTKERKLFLRSYLLNEKVTDNSINTLVQLLFYQTY